MSLAVLVNPTAGKGAALAEFDTAVRLLRAADHDPVLIRHDDPSDNRSALSNIVESGIERLVVVGGDGLVNMALQFVAETEVILGIVPAGTGNDFARGLGIDATTEAAVAGALGAYRPIDAMRSSDGWAASVITQGFSVVTNRVANRLPWPRDGRRYVVATALALPTLRTVPIVLTVDGQRHELQNTFLAIGNTRFFGSGTPICPGANPTSGVLDVVAIGPLTRRELITFYDSVPDETFLQNHRTAVFTGREVTVEGGTTDLWADGEPFGEAPMTISIVPGAVQIAGTNL